MTKNIIYSPETYSLQDIVKFKEKCEMLKVNAFLDLPNFALESDIKLLKSIIDNTNIGVIANNYYALFLSDNVVIGGGSVVVKDIPGNSVAVGNPCKVIRTITEEDKKTCWDR